MNLSKKKSNAFITHFLKIYRTQRVNRWCESLGGYFILDYLSSSVNNYMTVLCCMFGNNSDRAQRRGDPNCNDLIHHSHVAQHEDRHPEDIKGTNCDEWKGNNEGGIAVTRSHLLRGFAAKLLRYITSVASLSAFVECTQFWWFIKQFELLKMRSVM